MDIPFVKESAFILSGVRGIDIWLAPIPIENYGAQAQSFRVNELTGVKFTSLIKADMVALPVLFVLSWVFWGFIWKLWPFVLIALGVYILKNQGRFGGENSSDGLYSESKLFGDLKMNFDGREIGGGKFSTLIGDIKSTYI